MTRPALPHLLVLTDRTLARGRRLVDVVRGAPAVVLREKDLGSDERARLLAELRDAAPAVLVASDARLGRTADGVHLAASDPFPARRPPLVGRSCHTREDLARAAAEGCDYATLSPVFVSPSKPGYGPPLGTAALAGAPLPVFALGGIDAGNARACVDAGAHGVAVMGAVMAAADPQSAIADLLGVLA